MNVERQHVQQLESWLADRSEPSGPEQAPRPGPSESSEERPGFSALMERLGREVDRGESMLASIVGGYRTRQFSSAELIALQAGIYRYSETVDLAAKLVDRAGQAIRTTLQSSSG